MAASRKRKTTAFLTSDNAEALLPHQGALTKDRFDEKSLRWRFANPLQRSAARSGARFTRAFWRGGTADERGHLDGSFVVAVQVHSARRVGERQRVAALRLAGRRCNATRGALDAARRLHLWSHRQRVNGRRQGRARLLPVLTCAASHAARRNGRDGRVVEPKEMSRCGRCRPAHLDERGGAGAGAVTMHKAASGRSRCNDLDHPDLNS